MVSELVRERPYANEAGTARFVRRHGALHAADAYTQVAHLQLSSVGLGTYLGAPTAEVDASYVQAVTEAIRRGINVLDTASNYRCQRSERAIGQALRPLLDSGEIYRSEVLIASKAGFVPFDGQPPPDPAGWMRQGTVDAGLCRPDELVAGCHCLAPRYLQATLEQSLANLGLQTLDVYYLHNPETQLQVLDREAFDDRLRAAFQALEAAADAGHLRVYGVATWAGLRARPNERDYLSLERLVRLAEEVAGTRHRFKVVQLPLSLSMPEAFALRNQTVRGECLSVLEAAQRLGLVTFTSAPLHQGRLTRVRPSSPAHPVAELLPQSHVPQGGSSLAVEALQFARSAPGVTATLVGMARPEHVVDNARLLDVPRAPLAWLQSAARTLPSACYNG